MSEGSLHRIVLHTAGRKPLLAGDLRQRAEWAVRNLPARFPGLRLGPCRVEADGVELILDLGRLDEDVQRVVQSFKAEVKGLAKREGLPDGALWEWAYEDSPA